MQSRGDASSPYRLIRIRVSFGLWFRLRVVGCHQEATGKLEREKETVRGNTDRRRQRDVSREKESGTVRRGIGGWNIANHRISILMLRGGAVVNVGGCHSWRL